MQFVPKSNCIEEYYFWLMSTLQKITNAKLSTRFSLYEKIWYSWTATGNISTHLIKSYLIYYTSIISIPYHSFCLSYRNPFEGLLLPSKDNKLVQVAKILTVVAIFIRLFFKYTPSRCGGLWNEKLWITGGSSCNSRQMTEVYSLTLNLFKLSSYCKRNRRNY